MFAHVNSVSWLHMLPPEVVYAAVFLFVGIESLGIPLPGEVVLMSAALLASQGIVDPAFLWIAGATGAIVGDSTGYLIGHHYGYRLLHRLEKWFPRHVNARTIAFAERAFRRHGAKVVFFGRFIAILRIFAGPLSGILKVKYRRFLSANAAGGIIWSGLAVWTVYFLGIVAEHWFKRLSWVALGVAVIVGVVVSLVFRNKIEAYMDRQDEQSNE